MALLKQSTAYTRMFLLVQSSDHLTGLTGATPTVNVSKAGGTFAAAGGTITEVANGFYKIALTTTDTNTVGDLAFHVTAASGDATDFVDQVSSQITSDLMATYTQPTGFLAATFPSGTIANQTNITGGVITTVTTLTNLPAIPTNWITAAGITAAALNGKGDWLLASSYTAPTNLTAAQIAAGVWRDTVSGDFAVAASVGLSLMNGVALGTGLTVNDLTTKTGYSLATTQTFNNTGTWTGNIVGTLSTLTTYTGNTPQTGDSFARIGALGAGLTGITGVALAGIQTFNNTGTWTGNIVGTLSTLTTYTGNTVQTGDAYARLGAPAGVSVSFDVAAVKTDTAAVKVQTDKLAFTVANKVDANVLNLNGDATSAANIAKTTRAIGRGTASGVPTTTSIPTSAFAPSGAVADQFKGRIVTFDADTTTTALRGQATDITANTSAATPTLTVTALTTAPVAGDTFSVT